MHTCKKIEKGWIDAHCHLSVKDFAGSIEKELKAAKSEDILTFFETSYYEEHIKWNLENNFEGKHWCAGIHPYAEINKAVKFTTIEHLVNEREILAIGEIGLDKRVKDIAYQKKILLDQLQFSMESDLPVVFHVVGMHYELYKILKDNFPRIRGYIHSFIGNHEILNLYESFNLGFMIGGKITTYEKYSSIITEILRNKLFLFETDAPYQKPQYIDGEINNLKNLKMIVDKSISISKLDRKEIYEKQIENFNNMFIN